MLFILEAKVTSQYGLPYLLISISEVLVEQNPPLGDHTNILTHKLDVSHCIAVQFHDLAIFKYCRTAMDSKIMNASVL